MKTINHRFDVMKEYVIGKDVLDLGCIDHDARMSKNDQWQYAFIKRYARTILGVDIEEEEVNKLREMGHNIIHGDVETMELDKKFDVIIAGELIEHVGNQASFLANVKRHLRPGGIFIVTTPNAHAFRNIIRSLVFGCIPTNPQHTLWHSAITLKQIVEREGFKIVESYYYFDPYTSRWRYLVEKMISFVHASLSPNMIFILKIKNRILSHTKKTPRYHNHSYRSHQEPDETAASYHIP